MALGEPQRRMKAARVSVLRNQQLTGFFRRSDIVWRQAETEGQSNTSSTERKDGSHPTAAGEAPFWTTMTVKLKAASLNAKLEDDLFKFTPPEKAKKIDSLNSPTS